jgi:hypothetical protein
MRILEWLFGWNEWLWNLLPDNCERKDCKRWGCRGNENIIDGEVVCDYCHCADMLKITDVEKSKLNMAIEAAFEGGELVLTMGSGKKFTYEEAKI